MIPDIETGKHLKLLFGH